MKCAIYDNCPFEDVPDSENYSDFEYKVLDWVEYECAKYLELNPEEKEKKRHASREARKNGISKARRDIEKVKRTGPHFETQCEIRVVRQELGISAKELAKRIGQTPQSVYMWELGQTRTTVEGWEKLIKAMPEIEAYAKRAINETKDREQERKKRKKAYGRKIKLERYKKGLSDEELAQIVGVSVLTLHSWECGARMPRRESVLILEEIFPKLRGEV